MLVLSRKEDESVELLVDGRLVATVVVVSIDGNRTKLGFEAAGNVKVLRSELADRSKERIGQ